MGCCWEYSFSRMGESKLKVRRFPLALEFGVEGFSIFLNKILKMGVPNLRIFVS